MKPRVDWRFVLKRHWRLRIWSADELGAEFGRRRTAREQEQEADEEIAFRRGYLDGYSEAMDDMLATSKLGYSRVRECFNWLASHHDGPLWLWRYDRHPVKSYAERPPAFERPPAWSTQKEQTRRRDPECVECGANARLECDHVVPVSKGGRAELSNLRMLCAACHADRRRP